MAKTDFASLRAVGSEGNYHLYRLLKERRFFLAAKLASVSYKYWRGTGDTPQSNKIALIQGPNQLRHHMHSLGMSEARLGKLEAFTDFGRNSSLHTLPRIKTRQFLYLLLCVSRILCLGRRRDLSIFLLAFLKVAQSIVKEHLSDVSVFVCYNDQPFDVAALVHALNQRGGCKTIVVQHGLVLSHRFYFPTNAREFWAWGVLSQKLFTTRHAKGGLIITGRYDSDARSKSNDMSDMQSGVRLRTLIAFSFFQHEIKRGLEEVSKLRNGLSRDEAKQLQFDIKLHPAQKRRRKVLKTIETQFPWINVVEGNMEELTSNYDRLITAHSTSAVDFMLQGKPVYFLTPNEGPDFPSSDYGFALSEFFTNDPKVWARKNSLRLAFLRDALNV